MYQTEITYRNAKAIITANDKTGPFTARMYVNGGETATTRTTRAKSLDRCKKQALEMLKKHYEGR